MTTTRIADVDFPALADLDDKYVSDMVFTYRRSDFAYEHRYYVVADGVEVGWVIRDGRVWRGYAAQCGAESFRGAHVSDGRSRDEAAREMARRSIRKAVEWWLYSSEARYARGGA